MSKCKNVTLLLVLFGAMSIAATAQAETRGIVNGEVYHGHPAVGQVFSKEGSCTGTLIGENTVLTAAHCVKNNETVTFTVERNQYSGIGFSHPSYIEGNFDENWPSDIAIIRLNESIHEIEPIPLCSQLNYPKGWPISIVGFGRTGYDAGGAGVKRLGTTKINSNVIDSPKLSSGYHNSGTCNGDSGGPALIKGSIKSPECIVGVVSGGHECSWKSYYVRPDYYSDWIEDTAERAASSIEWVIPELKRQTCFQDEGGEFCDWQKWDCSNLGQQSEDDLSTCRWTVSREEEYIDN